MPTFNQCAGGREVTNSMIRSAPTARCVVFCRMIGAEFGSMKGVGGVNNADSSEFRVGILLISIVFFGQILFFYLDH